MTQKPPLLLLTALVTPLKNQGEIDQQGFKNLVNYQKRQGINELLLLGSTGEALLLEEEERDLLLKNALEMEEICWWLGCLEKSQKQAQRWIEKTAAFPIKGYLLSTPYYIKPSQKELESYFLALLDLSSHPCILYHNPSRSGVEIEESLLFHLMHHPRFLGIKECRANPLRIRRLKERLHSEQFLLAGNDEDLPGALCAGANGAVSVLSNAFPSLARFLLQSFFSEKPSWKETTALWLEGCQLLGSHENPKSIKTLLHTLLQTSPFLKPPLRELETETRHQMETKLFLFLKKIDEQTEQTF